MAKILVIDDSNFQRKKIAQMVSELGHEVSQAKNGKEGSDIIIEKGLHDAFDCVCCDLLMPEMGGLEFLAKMKEEASTIPVVILTADKQLTSREEALSLGAKNVLNKPPKVDDLKTAIEKILA